MTDAATVLTFEDVAYVIGGARVLDRVTFTLRASERLAIVGDNGSGKSSTARLAAALAEPANGCVRLFETDTRGLDADRQRRLRGRIGMVSQGGSLLADLSVEDNLKLGLGAQRSTDPRRQRTKIDRALLDFQLENIGGRIVDRLSTGERRRVELARAFLRDPEMLVFDDPFDGADATAAAALEAQMVNLLARRPRALLLLTQNRAMAERLSPTVLTLSRGRLIQQPEADVTPAARS